MLDVLQAGRHIAENSLQLLRVGPRTEHTLLRTAELCSRHGFHGFRELLRILDGPDSPPDI
jgi:hypothetical protein